MPLSRRLAIYTTVILIVLHGANAVFIGKLVHSSQENAMEARASRARLLGEHAGRSIGAIDIALQQIAKGLGADPEFGAKSIRLHMMLREAVSQLPQVRAITILDADGLLIQDSRHYPARPISFADYPNFIQQKKWRGVGLYIDAPRISKNDGLPFFSLSRPILDSDGNLRGVVAALADPEYFVGFYGTRKDGGGGIAALARNDGAILATVVAPGDPTGIMGMDVGAFLRKNPHHASVAHPVPGLPLQIVVTSSSIWTESSLRSYVISDAALMLVLTALAVMAAVTLVKEAGAREIAERRLLDAIESAPAGFTLFDANDRLVMCNDMYGKLFGLPREFFTPGIRFEDLLGAAMRGNVYDNAGEADGAIIERRLSEHREPHGETLQKLRGGRWILTRWRRANDSGVVYFHTDITQVKEQEQALRAAGEAERAAREQAEAANRAKSTFLATMSHELRTPLNAVIGFSEIIELETFGPVAPRYREYGSLIVKSGRHLLKIINDILDIAKLQSGKTELHLESVDPATSMREATAMLSWKAKEVGVSLRCEPDECLPPIFVDVTRLRQILINLLSNALKFTPSGGMVSLRAHAGASDVLIEVADTGIGISPEDLPKALEPFGQIENALTRTQDGTGLGLPLTKNLVESHGGVFEIESEVGKGTTVRIRLPCVAAPREGRRLEAQQANVA